MSSAGLRCGFRPPPKSSMKSFLNVYMRIIFRMNSEIISIPKQKIGTFVNSDHVFLKYTICIQNNKLCLFCSIRILAYVRILGLATCLFGYYPLSFGGLTLCSFRILRPMLFSFFAVGVLNACLTKCVLDLALSCLPSETRPGMGR